MPRAKKIDDPTTLEDESVEEAPRWTQEELLDAKRFGPGIIGEEMWAAAQAVAERTADGRFGPALL